MVVSGRTVHDIRSISEERNVGPVRAVYPVSVANLEPISVFCGIKHFIGDVKCDEESL